MGATCHPPEECVIRDSKWISRFLAEKRRKKSARGFTFSGERCSGLGLSLRMRKRPAKKDDPKANCKSFSFLRNDTSPRRFKACLLDKFNN